MRELRMHSGRYDRIMPRAAVIGPQQNHRERTRCAVYLGYVAVTEIEPDENNAERTHSSLGYRMLNEFWAILKSSVTTGNPRTTPVPAVFAGLHGLCPVRFALFDADKTNGKPPFARRYQ